jgi:glyoxylase-like metal-dependent hydrolase (beta-lactamase superfamily II)/8-oxo-dGTP pyrophosphatase MutT (NUDIX family)
VLYFSFMAAIPKDAAAIILLKDPSDPKVFWVKRNPKLMFMGGFHAFPGGQLDRDDVAIPVSNCEGEDAAAMRACAIREFFEETGVLLATGAGDRATEQLADMRSALARKEASFKQIIESNDLRLDGGTLVPAGRWVTPPFAPRRFDTWFFLAWLPDSQEPAVEEGELVMGEWIRPAEALKQWTSGEIIMAPPTLYIIKTLAANLEQLDQLPSALTAIPEASRGMVSRIEFKPGIFLFPVKTKTLPPATHTNCYIIGSSEVIIIDPGSTYEEEQTALDNFIDELIAEGRKVREIFLTHHHPDHVGGVNHLSRRLGVPVAAHRLTAERLGQSVTVDRFVEDNELIELPGDPGWRLRALHTPGHTRGHLCFYEEITGSVITGDLLIGLGTVVIDPPEGNMQQYFDSLDRLKALPKLSSLFGGHGPAIGSARHKIDEYIQHRLMRESKIMDAVRQGEATPAEIVERAYTDVASAMYWLAERSTVAHLERLEENGFVKKCDGDRYRAL